MVLVCSPCPEDEEDRTGETESFKGTEESEQSERSELLYGIDDSPSWILSLLLGFQVSSAQSCSILSWT